MNIESKIQISFDDLVDLRLALNSLEDALKKVVKKDCYDNIIYKHHHDTLIQAKKVLKTICYNSHE